MAVQEGDIRPKWLKPQTYYGAINSFQFPFEKLFQTSSLLQVGLTHDFSLAIMPALEFSHSQVWKGLLQGGSSDLNVITEE